MRCYCCSLIFVTLEILAVKWSFFLLLCPSFHRFVSHLANSNGVLQLWLVRFCLAVYNSKVTLFVQQIFIHLILCENQIYFLIKLSYYYYIYYYCFQILLFKTHATNWLPLDSWKLCARKKFASQIYVNGQKPWSLTWLWLGHTAWFYVLVLGV